MIGLDPRRFFDPDVWSAALQRKRTMDMIRQPNDLYPERLFGLERRAGLCDGCIEFYGHSMPELYAYLRREMHKK